MGSIQVILTRLDYLFTLHFATFWFKLYYNLLLFFFLHTYLFCFLNAHSSYIIFILIAYLNKRYLCFIFLFF